MEKQPTLADRQRIGAAPSTRGEIVDPVPLKEPQVPPRYRDATGRIVQETLAKEGDPGTGQRFVREKAGVPTSYPGLPGNFDVPPNTPGTDV